MPQDIQMLDSSRAIQAAAQAIDTELKTMFQRSEFLVTFTSSGEFGDSITVELMRAPVSPLKQSSMYRVELNPWMIQNSMTNVEPLSQLTPVGLRLMRRVVNIVLAHRKSHIDDQLPLFAFRLAIGGWNKPFEVMG